MSANPDKTTDCREASRPPLALGGLYAVIQTFADAITPPPITELDAGLTDDERRTSVIENQIAFQDAISTPSRNFDEVDLEVEELLDPPNKRSGREINKLLSLLDALETSNDEGGLY